MIKLHYGIKTFLQTYAEQPDVAQLSFAQYANNSVSVSIQFYMSPRDTLQIQRFKCITISA